MRGVMPAPFETSFAGALLDAGRPIPDGVTAHNAAIPTRRFGVYRNNVVTGLVKVLRARFPAVEKIVGEEFFAEMARVFVAERPPRTPLLAAYGDDFAAFIAAFEPARELGFVERRRGGGDSLEGLPSQRGLDGGIRSPARDDGQRRLDPRRRNDEECARARFPAGRVRPR